MRPRCLALLLVCAAAGCGGSDATEDPGADGSPPQRTDATCEEAVQRLCEEACRCSSACRFGETNSTSGFGDDAAGCARQLVPGLCGAPNADAIDWGACDARLMSPVCATNFEGADFLVLPGECQT